MDFIYLINIYLIIASISGMNSESHENRVKQVRKSVLSYFSSNPELAYTSDIEVVANKDWLIDSFLNSVFANKDPAKSLIESLKAWKSDKILELNDSSFPSELWGLGYWYDFGISKAGTPMVGAQPACAPPYGKVDSLISEMSLKFMKYILRKIIFESGERNYYGYINAGIANMADYDLQTSKDILMIHALHWPRYPAKDIVYKMNAIVKALIKGLYSTLIPNFEGILQFPSTEEELNKFLSLDEVPVHNGGRNTSFIFIPEGVKSAKCLIQNPKDKEIWDNLKNLRIDCFMRSLELSGKSSLEEFLKEC